MAGFAFTVIAFCILGYLVGNVLFAQVLAHSFYNKNLRAEGSFNPGATNLVRTTKNRWVGIVASILDATKCFLIIMVCGFATRNNPHLGTWGHNGQNWAIFIPGLFVIFGHCFPLMYFITLIKKNSDEAKKFSGGKGVSAFGGMVIAFSPYVALIAIALWVIVLLISRYVSLASIFAVLISTGLIWATPLQIWWFTKIPFTSLWGVFVIFLIAGCYIIYRHKANIGRIFKKTETKAFSKK